MKSVEEFCETLAEGTLIFRKGEFDNQEPFTGDATDYVCEDRDCDAEAEVYFRGALMCRECVRIVLCQDAEDAKYDDRD